MMTKFRVLAAAVAAGAALLMGGCDTVKVAATPVGGETATQLKNDVYIAKTTYQGLLVVAVNYNALPRCGHPTSPPLCSSQAAIDQIRRADATAFQALDAAEAAVRSIGPDTTIAAAAVVTARQAVQAMKVILPSNPAPK